MSKLLYDKAKKKQNEKDFVDETLRGFEQLVYLPNFDLSFLTFWLGDECTKGKDKICDRNTNYFIKVAKTYPANFFPFYRLDDTNRDSYITSEMQNGQFTFIITLNRDTPGAFDLFYSDYFIGDPSKVYLSKVEAKNESDLLDIFNQILKNKKIFFRVVGQPSDPYKYGLVSVLGKGVFGINYLAKNMNVQPGESEYYAVKFLLVDPNHPNDALKEWEKEKQCLIDVLEICKQGGVLCYHDSFVFNEPDGTQSFVIITPFLEGYTTLNDILTKIVLSEKDAKNIYSQVVNIKNNLTDLCISHSDMHTGNIMYNPTTKDVKLIDFGRCQTPEEEVDEWYGDIRRKGRTEQQKKEDWRKYSDEARLKQLRSALYLNVKQSSPLYSGEEDILFKDLVKQSIPGCKRVKKNI